MYSRDKMSHGGVYFNCIITVSSSDLHSVCSVTCTYCVLTLRRLCVLYLSPTLTPPRGVIPLVTLCPLLQ